MLYHFRFPGEPHKFTVFHYSHPVEHSIYELTERFISAVSPTLYEGRNTISRGGRGLPRYYFRGRQSYLLQDATKKKGETAGEIQSGFPSSPPLHFSLSACWMNIFPPLYRWWNQINYFLCRKKFILLFVRHLQRSSLWNTGQSFSPLENTKNILSVLLCFFVFQKKKYALNLHFFFFT